ncbi:MAG: type II toxin-antitoxin system VapC family toxin [bacterium]|nr:type II toxin-antitoxin system VapC family toxin [bacterium]
MLADRVVEIRQQKRIKFPDAIIAATALEKRCELVTRNVDDFKNIHENLQITNPFASE